MTTAFDVSDRPTILAVDDAPDNLSLIAELLQGEYRVQVANSGDKALRIVRGERRPDLILLDIVMPGMDGYEVCRLLKADPASRGIPVIFLTAMLASENERKGLELGAVDYITKPISPPIVLARIRTHLQIKAAADFLRDKNAFLESEIARRTGEIEAIQDVTVLVMTSLAETRDNETGNHIVRTQYYLDALARRLKNRARFRRLLDDRAVGLLFKSAPLHDIGKIGIPDRILLKPGRLDAAEFEVMKTHTTLGRDAIRQAETRLGTEVDFLRYAKEIALCHHERWDGGGYPLGKAGDEIPLSARMMAVADVYDALISRRVYKEGMSHEEALEIIRQGRGTHFDPDIADAFRALESTFREIARRFSDHREGCA